VLGESEGLGEANDLTSRPRKRLVCSHSVCSRKKFGSASAPIVFANAVDVNTSLTQARPTHNMTFDG
jgi:hypothetical protein